MDVTVNDLEARNEISIRTLHSEYRFQLMDPLNCSGLLSGGLLGEQHVAILRGAIGQDHHVEVTTELRIGNAAFFIVYVRDVQRRLTTSAIVDLKVKRIAVEEKDPGEC
jgi:hypothetical protein